MVFLESYTFFGVISEGIQDTKLASIRQHDGVNPYERIRLAKTYCLDLDAKSKLWDAGYSIGLGIMHGCYNP